MGAKTDDTLVLQAQNAVLEMIAKGHMLEHIIEKLALEMEHILPGTICSILYFNKEGNTLENWIAPNLNEEYVQAIGGLKIGSCSGSCGTAAFRKETVIVENIETDPLWKGYRSFPLAYGYRACYSIPILSSKTELFGTFALYYREPRKAQSIVIDTMKAFAYLASLAIEHAKTEEIISRSEEKYRLMAENVSDFIGIINEYGVIEYTSPSHETYLGYPSDYVLGKVAFDFVHPDDLYILKQTFKKLMQTNTPQKLTFRFRHQQGHWIYGEGRAAPIKEKNGNEKDYVYVVRDVTEQMQADENIYQLAYYDTLTNLPNEVLFLEHLTNVLKANGKERKEVALLYIDVKRFNYINDTFGREFGNDVLKQIAKRLTISFLNVYRISGDEFVIMLRNKTQKEVENKVHSLIEAFENPFTFGHQQLHLGISVGISLYPEHGKTPLELMEHANIAVRYSKKHFTSHHQYYSHVMSHMIDKRIELENRLRLSLINKEFILYYQPQIDILSGETIGSEALLRWNNPDLGIVSPVDFIPILEETGLIVPVGKWVLLEACKQQKKWLNEGIRTKSVSVNLSVMQLYQEDLIPSVIEVLNETGLDPKYLVLEITETAVLKKVDLAVGKLQQLRNLGVKIALDDFGTGYSSLNHLKDLPIDIVKIDKSFLNNITNDLKVKKILKTIILLIKQLGLKVLVEGVETEEHFQYLKANHCHQVQGFLFSAPVPSEIFQEMFQVEHV